MLLTETFTASFPAHLFSWNHVFVSPGVRLTDAKTARLSGGVALLIRKKHISLVKQTHLITVLFSNFQKS